MVVASLGLAAPAMAALPVGVHVYNDQHGTVVQVDIQGQPAAAAGTVDGNVCVGFSYQLPVCLPGS